METRNHKKNGAKPKSLKSRKQIYIIMKSFNILVLATFLCSAFLFSSCNNLSRGKAKKIVLSKIKKDDLHISFYFSSFYGGIQKEQSFTSKGNLNELIERGYVTLDDDNRHITLTDKVMPFTTVERNSYGYVHISVASFKDIKITGIKGNDNLKRVEYQKIYELNALGKEINYNDKIVIKNHTDLQKYDDVWR